MNTQFKHKEPLLPPLASFEVKTEQCASIMYKGNVETQCEFPGLHSLNGVPLCRKHLGEHRDAEREAYFRN